MYASENNVEKRSLKMFFDRRRSLVGLKTLIKKNISARSLTLLFFCSVVMV